ACPCTVRAAHRPAGQAPPRREPLQDRRRPDTAPCAGPHRRGHRVRAVAVLAGPARTCHPGARSAGIRHLEPPSHSPAVFMTSAVHLPPHQAPDGGDPPSGRPADGTAPRSRRWLLGVWAVVFVAFLAV